MQPIRPAQITAGYQQQQKAYKLVKVEHSLLNGKWVKTEIKDTLEFKENKYTLKQDFYI